MNFRYEKEMLGVVKEELPHLLNIEKPYAVASEVHFNYRKVDLCILEINTADLHFYDLSPLRKLTMNELWYVAIPMWVHSANSNCVDVEQYYNNFNNASKNIKTKLLKKIPDLHDESFALDISSKLKNIVGSLILVELKLYDWSSLVNQAVYCNKIADITCTVMDGDRVHKIPIDPFMKEGIGLYAAWQNRLEAINHPLIRKFHCTPENLYYRLRAILDLINNSQGKWELVD
jgi:hypothetical protein